MKKIDKIKIYDAGVKVDDVILKMNELVDRVNLHEERYTRYKANKRLDEALANETKETWEKFIKAHRTDPLPGEPKFHIGEMVRIVHGGVVGKIIAYSYDDCNCSVNYLVKTSIISLSGSTIKDYIYYAEHGLEKIKKLKEEPTNFKFKVGEKVLVSLTDDAWNTVKKIGTIIEQTDYCEEDPTHSSYKIVLDLDILSILPIYVIEEKLEKISKPKEEPTNFKFKVGDLLLAKWISRIDGKEKEEIVQVNKRDRYCSDGQNYYKCKVLNKPERYSVDELELNENQLEEFDPMKFKYPVDGTYAVYLKDDNGQVSQESVKIKSRFISHDGIKMYRCEVLHNPDDYPADGICLCERLFDPVYSKFENSIFPTIQKLESDCHKSFGGDRGITPSNDDKIQWAINCLNGVIIRLENYQKRK